MEEPISELTSVVGDQVDLRSVGKYPVVDEVLRDLGCGDVAEKHIAYELCEAVRYQAYVLETTCCTHEFNYNVYTGGV